ncbi:MAG: glycosyltransferase, partial [Vicinamibacterales bacterium]
MTLRVSVIVVAWNRRDATLRAVASAYRQSYGPHEVVLVDAGSVDGTVEHVRERFADVVVVSLGENRGVPGNRNAGAEVAAGDVLFFLDNDALLERCALEQTVECFTGRPRLMAIGARILARQSEEVDRYAWVYPFAPSTCERRPFRTYTFAGGACAIRRDAFVAAG